MINRFFTREKMARLAPKVREYAIDVMAPLIEQRCCDIAVDYAQKYPAHVFAEFFNLPHELSLLIKEVSAAYVAAIQVVDDETVKKSEPPALRDRGRSDRAAQGQADERGRGFDPGAAERQEP